MYLLCDAVVGYVVGDDLFEHVVVDLSDRNASTIDEEIRSLIHAHVFGELYACFDSGFGLGGLRAGFHFVRVLSCLGHCAVQGERSSLFGGEAGLSVIDGCGIVEESLVASELGNARSIRSSAEGLGMDLR